MGHGTAANPRKGAHFVDAPRAEPPYKPKPGSYLFRQVWSAALTQCYPHVTPSGPDTGIFVVEMLAHASLGQSCVLYNI